MRVIFRADASVTQGSGHVMRCLTLAEELRAKGHEVVFASSIGGIEWLDETMRDSGYSTVPAIADEIDTAALVQLRPDWVVVDSYLIPAEEISALAEVLPVFAIVDGSTRGIRAQLYLDQNLGAEAIDWDVPRGSMLAGAQYALIRDGFLAVRRPDPSALVAVPQVTAFMGGTDPSGIIVEVARELAKVPGPLTLTVIAPAAHTAAVRHALAGHPARVITPTAELPTLLGSSDVIVSAAGTSAWDVCTLAIPAVFVGVIDNQSPSLAAIAARGYALGIDLVLGESLDRLSSAVDGLARDAALRARLSAQCATVFDGLGKNRVVAAMTAQHGGRR